MNKKYTAGFLFDMERENVVLIRKLRPEWQKGRYNGVGGRIEPGETPAACQRREFAEEAGREIVWNQLFCVLSTGHGTEISFFRAFTSELDAIHTNTDEPVEIFPVRALPNVLPNLRWLIPMALSMDEDSAACFYICELEEAHAAALAAWVTEGES